MVTWKQFVSAALSLQSDDEFQPKYLNKWCFYGLLFCGLCRFVAVSNTIKDKRIESNRRKQKRNRDLLSLFLFGDAFYGTRSSQIKWTDEWICWLFDVTVFGVSHRQTNEQNQSYHLLYILCLQYSIYRTTTLEFHSALLPFLVLFWSTACGFVFTWILLAKQLVPFKVTTIVSNCRMRFTLVGCHFATGRPYHTHTHAHTPKHYSAVAGDWIAQLCRWHIVWDNVTNCLSNLHVPNNMSLMFDVDCILFSCHSTAQRFSNF